MPSSPLVEGILGRSLTAEGVAWCVWGLSLALAVVGAVLWFLNRDLGGAVFVPHLLLVPGFASVGVVVAVRRRSHQIGWLFLGMGLVAALTGFGFQYAVRAGITAPGSLPAGWLLAAIAAWTWPLSFAGLWFVLVLFPDGGLPSPRWRPVAWALGLSFGAAFVWGVVRPEPIDLSVLKVDNPLGITLLERLVGEPLERLLGWVVLLVWVVTILACLLAPFLRWRQAGWEARQQLKWLALVAAMSAVLAVAGFLLTLTDVAPVLGRPAAGRRPHRPGRRDSIGCGGCHPAASAIRDRPDPQPVTGLRRVDLLRDRGLRRAGERARWLAVHPCQPGRVAKACLAR